MCDGVKKSGRRFGFIFFFKKKEHQLLNNQNQNDLSFLPLFWYCIMKWIRFNAGLSSQISEEEKQNKFQISDIRHQNVIQTKHQNSINSTLRSMGLMH